jgi:predicted  nucleic acid-binding Zn-ribbon protein
MHTAKLARVNNDLETAKLRVKTIESERKRLELEAEGHRERIARYSAQQLETRKNEEYKALANEIETCNREIHKLEDQQLELMEQAEAAQRQIAAAKQAANNHKKVVDTALKDLEEKEQNLRAELVVVQAERATLSAQVDESALLRYERMLRNKGANVVVGVQHSVCGGCHMKLPTQLIIHCQAAQELVVCINCGRLLYFTPDMDVAVAD